jgi:hypothetical protein
VAEGLDELLGLLEGDHHVGAAEEALEPAGHVAAPLRKLM